MAKDKLKKKKIVKTTDNKGGGSTQNTPQKKKVVVKKSKVAKSSYRAEAVEMPFNKENFKWIGIGLGLMALGFVMMLGGNNEDPNVWDPNVIYNWRITTVAPILILAGLGVQIYAIFKK